MTNRGGRPNIARPIRLAEARPAWLLIPMKRELKMKLDVRFWRMTPNDFRKDDVQLLSIDHWEWWILKSSSTLLLIRYRYVGNRTVFKYEYRTYGTYRTTLHEQRAHHHASARVINPNPQARTPASEKTNVHKKSSGSYWYEYSRTVR